MSKLAMQVTEYHKLVDKTLLRVLSLLLGFYHIAMIMWDPELYSQSIGGFNAVISPLMIWALCASMVFGVGFRPRKWFWQLLFSPYISLSILIYLTIIRLV
ncbi:cyd operon protein YbgE [Vibrio anguillarum]|uniref:Cyd operon protein YbgE n=2 Tax=Vibrio TaxID=662 RepID=A0A191W4K2_VIBAN|nr:MULTISPECIES: cyd operon protein YbgE [Vibrio]MCS0351847.1 cyd operon protein YbgE [Vibrio ordalii]NAW90501.1 cyd operon protein YbgE [Vibrio sp. V24_P1S3T111]NAW97380.1 cyd operon protein YbgE [Vibrio sp. V23_P3S9T160]NAX43292.1 cyd operon protein YbgE [Vibrio sp. V25_P4S6T154]NCO47026.1 cyd operon protein YbgE [Vibrio sp.]NNN46302.1 cyd operon protein YbgE [Vibrio sp. 2-2(8)]NNN67667.1 cyd operon protein YbgE [Vibrio sp. 3-2(1)]NNN76001.1 cyd operon protein YbgE [Vibrio sp. B7]NNN9381